jgi:hypothetical protein
LLNEGADEGKKAVHLHHWFGHFGQGFICFVMDGGEKFVYAPEESL